MFNIKRYLSTIILITFALVSFSACSNSPVTKSIVEPNTPQTFLISDGIEVTMIAPIGFSITKEHYGFAQPESFSRIKIVEKEYTYDQYVKSLSKENFLHNQLHLLNKKEIEVNGTIGTFITLRQNIAGTYFEKLLLIVGDNLSSIQVEASYPEGVSEKHRQAIKKAILDFNVEIQPNKRIFTGLPFKLTSTEDFKIKQRYTNSIVLVPNIDTNKLQSVVISHGSIKQQIEDIQVLSEYFLKNSKSFKNIVITHNEMIKLDNIPALATIATATVGLNNEETIVYQVLSYQKERFLLIQGQVLISESDTFIDRIKQLLSNFKFK